MKMLLNRKQFDTKLQRQPTVALLNEWWVRFLFFFCLTTSVFAQEANFTAANAAYQQGHPEEAVSLYETMQKSGAEDAALYYNLGNAYAAQGFLGKAILSYTRSLRLNPGAQDARANLEIARRAAAEHAEPARSGPLLAGPESELGGTQTPRQLGLQAFWLYAAAFTFLGVALFARRTKKDTLATLSVGLSLLSAIGALSFMVISWRRATSLNEEKRAVVLASNTNVRRGPIENAESLYALPEGEIIVLEERRDSWGLVRVSGKPEGWVSLTQVEPVLR